MKIQTLHLLQELQLRGIVPDVITYSAAISACEKSQQAQQALHLLQELQLRGILPNVITYSAAISACEKGRPGRALPKEAGIDPSRAVRACTQIRPTLSRALMAAL